MLTALDNGRRSPKRLLRAVVARLLGRKPWATSEPAIVSQTRLQSEHWTKGSLTSS
jgi:hypothetical protein